MISVTVLDSPAVCVLTATIGANAATDECGQMRRALDSPAEYVLMATATDCRDGAAPDHQHHRQRETEGWNT